MTISVSTVHVLVDDPDAALTFYRDTLGFAVKFEVENGGFRWINLSPPDQPDLTVVLSQPQPGRSEENAEALAALLAKGELSPMHLRTDDLEATFDKIANAPGAEVVQEPTDQPWGVRDAAFRDPAGNFLRIEQA